MTPRYTRLMDSPLGVLRLVATPAALTGVYLPAQQCAHLAEAVEAASHPVLDRAAAELGEYFLGERTSFSTPVVLEGTPFQRSVWEVLGTIPFGEQRSYTWLAREVGRPRAARAAGAANGRNVLSIIVPCHRVVGADGALTGYAGGVEAKRWLLAHERRERARVLG